MKKVIILLLVIGIYSCQNNQLKKEFDCTVSTNISEYKEYRDVLKNFKIKLPETWRTKLYYDDYSSEIFSADTTKKLTESYILDISWRQGELELNDTFSAKFIDSLQLKSSLKTLKSGFGKFKKKPMYFNLSKGSQNGFPYQYLQVYLKTNIDEYITLSSKVYGETGIDERLCESIDIFDRLQLIE